MPDSFKYEKHKQQNYMKQESETMKHHPPQVSNGKIIAKVPVVLTELTLQVQVDTTIEFPEPVLEIKDVKKQLKITQSRLLLPANKLFLKGFVRKNIQYASPSKEISSHTETSISSDLHSLTVDIPIHYIAEIKNYISKPKMPEFNKRHEYDFSESDPLKESNSENDEFLSSNVSQYHQESTHYYNELPYAELISSKMIEWDEAIDRRPLPMPAPFDEGYFTKMEEKMIVDFVIRVLQNQQVQIDSIINDQDGIHYYHK
nr:DUF3794 domain-containing protein [uncultured Bacillus sp.]